MAQVIYTVYEMYERLSPTGQPYIGSTVNIEERRRQWRRQLGLAQKPILHILAEFTDDDEAFDYENALRVANGWKREHNRHFRKMLSRPEIKALRAENMKSVGKEQGRKNSETGHIQSLGRASKGGSYVGNATKGRYWMNNGRINKRVQPERLMEYIKDGFILGRIPKR